MFHKFALIFCVVTLAMMGFAASSHAVSLGKIDVASHLGEPFYAEVPLTLDEGEEVTAIAVGLASPSDYRILEVYYANVLSQIKADIENDSRGLRVELSSSSLIHAPFVNIILKVRNGLATHYKKYPIFLDLPRTATAPLTVKPEKPVVKMEQTFAPADASGDRESLAVIPVVGAVQADEVQAGESSNEVAGAYSPYEKWARTAKYGPMVYGDTVTVVARRLRVDGRYTNEQVMVALFEKNRSQFAKDNINLIKAGTYLDVPTAEEVERIRPEQARNILSEHTKRWRQEPRYAAVAEAQRTRYSSRIRVGKSADGVAAKPMMEASDETSNSSQETSQDSSKEDANQAATEATVSAIDTASVANEQMNAVSSENAALKEEMAALQQKNNALQASLAENAETITKLSAVAKPSPEVEAVATARVKKLELQLARLQAELDDAKENVVVESVESEMDWLIYLLGGLVVVLLIGIAILLSRKKPEHPAMESFSEEVIEDTGDDLPAFVEHESGEVADFQDDVADTIEQEPSFPELPDDEVSFDDEASIPELTDEDTSQFEAMQEEVEEEADPNVDYLSEADVYMRYGMEDEAEQQVKMALKLREDHRDAHIKLVQIRKARGDEEGAENAITAAKAILLGDALNLFEESISESLSVTGENSLDDTIPPGELDVSEVSSEPQMIESSEQESADLSDGLPDELDLDGFDFDLGEVADEEDLSKEDTPIKEDSAADVEVATAESADQPDELDLGGLDFDLGETSDEEETSKEDDSVDVEVNTEASPVAGDDLDFDLSGLDMPDSPSEPISTESAAVDSGDFDLSDIEIPLDDMLASDDDDDDESLQTSDLDKTVVMDWDKDTLVGLGDDGKESTSDVDLADPLDHPDFLQIGSEKSADLVEGEDVLDFDLGELGDAGGEATPEQASVASTDDSGDFGLESLDLDLGASEEKELDILDSSMSGLAAFEDLDETMQLDSLLDELGSMTDEDKSSDDAEKNEDSKA